MLRWILLTMKRFLLRRAKVALRNFVTVQANIFVRSLLVAGVAALVGRGRRTITVSSTRLKSREIEGGQEFSESYDASLLAKGEN